MRAWSARKTSSLRHVSPSKKWRRTLLALNLVGIFVDWIYTQKLLLSPGREDATPGEEQSNYQIAMLKASIFSDRFLSPDFSTAVRHGFIHALNQSQKLYCRTVIYAYANLPPEDPLLRLLEDVYSHGCGFCHRDKDNDKLDDLPKTFLVNVMKALTEEQMHWVADSRTLNEYDYHNHTSAEEKAKCPWSS